MDRFTEMVIAGKLLQEGRLDAVLAMARGAKAAALKGVGKGTSAVKKGAMSARKGTQVEKAIGTYKKMGKLSYLKGGKKTGLSFLSKMKGVNKAAPRVKYIVGGAGAAAGGGAYAAGKKK